MSREARALAAGLAGTAAMTVSTALEHRWRGEIGHPVNPDDSDHVAEAVGTVLRRPPHTSGEQRAYFMLAHWGYGSAVALTHPPLRRAAPDELRAALLLWAGCQTMAMVLFPTLGGTRGPHHWPRDVILSSVVHHVVYVVAVTAVDRALTGPPVEAHTARSTR